VTDLKIELDGLGSVLITWTPPVSQIVDLLRYNVTYQVIGVGDCNDTYREPEQSLDVAPTDRRVTITDLEPWRKYQFSIVASNVGGYGEMLETTFYSREIGKLLIFRADGNHVNIIFNKKYIKYMLNFKRRTML
jgi:hypothetical protein